MSGHAFRFLHASQLLLDEPIEGLTHIPDSLRDHLEDASLNAFQNLIQAAIDHEVAFVLLLGNSFVEQSTSLRARVALLSGLRELAAHGICVFVLPGEHDPIPAWRHIPSLPENVTLFNPSEQKPVTAIHDGHAIATVHLADQFRAQQHQPSNKGLTQHADLFRIVLQLSDSEVDWSSQIANQHCDYIALGGPARKTVNVAQLQVHASGSLLGQKAQQFGSHGASLLHVSAEGDLRNEFLALSPFRRETRQIFVTPQSNHEQILQEIERAIGQVKLAETEDLILFQWDLRGLGNLFDRLQQPTHKQQLLDQIQSATKQFDAAVLHQIQHMTDLEPAKNTWTENELASEFLQQLRKLTADRDQFQKLMWQLAADAQTGTQQTDAQWKHFTKQIEQEAIIARCRQIGLQHFARPAA